MARFGLSFEQHSAAIAVWQWQLKRPRCKSRWELTKATAEQGERQLENMKFICMQHVAGDTNKSSCSVCVVVAGRWLLAAGRWSVVAGPRGVWATCPTCRMSHVLHVLPVLHVLQFTVKQLPMTAASRTSSINVAERTRLWNACGICIWKITNETFDTKGKSF